MQGGYVDDKFVQGGSNPDAYSIWHWYLMDVFVYFSHSLVTLPPPCWTNAAHRHGVKVLIFLLLVALRNFGKSCAQIGGNMIRKGHLLVM
ncbi:Cytosolic endo-beta-N-acetylglucosaminidase 2 [Linum grandiflorum]